MVKRSTNTREFRDAGAVHTLLNLWALISDHMLLTKSGDLAVVLKMEPRDYECLDAGELAEVPRRFEAALRSFDPLFRVYQYTFKRSGASVPQPTHLSDAVVEQALGDRARYLDSKAADLYTTDSYIVVIYEGSRYSQVGVDHLQMALRDPIATLKAFFSVDKTTLLIDEAVTRGMGVLSNKVNSFVVQLRDAVNLEIATKDEAFHFYRRLLNFNPDKADSVHLHHDCFVDYFVCDSGLECYRDHLRLDEYFVKILTLKDPPPKTHPNMLRALQELPSQYIIATEFVPVDNLAMRSLIKRNQRHAFNSKTSLLSNLNLQGDSSVPADQLVDESAVAQVGELNQCLTALEMEGTTFGQFTLTVILYDKDLKRLEKSVAEAFKCVAGHGATLYQESYNLLNAFMAALPANSRYNLRSVYLPTACFADLSLLFAPHPGEPIDAHLGAQCLAVLETRQKSLYRLNFHYKDLVHGLILGMSGSGKSFLINFLLTAAQQYAPRTVIFDLGGSYEMLTKLFGGSYMPIARKDRPFTINPFSLEPTPDNRQFLFSFVKVLIESSGGYTMTDHDERELFTQIGSLYMIEASQRRLMTLVHILPKHLEQYLRRWIEGGQYGDVFDSAKDTLTFARFQTFDFSGMDEYPQILEPLLFYILHRATTTISDPADFKTFKLCMIDEAWRFLRNNTVKQYIVEGMKTWRKCNAAMFLATQSAVDLAENGMLQAVADNCATLLFLANPRLDRNQFARCFGSMIPSSISSPA